jgi:xanthine dehydrogenase YagR molybdenum-binding subunit
MPEKAMDRPDGPEKVSGRARYSGDIAIAGMLHAVVVQSVIAAGRISAIDTKRAAAAPGVKLVMTHENAQKLPEQGQAGFGPPAGRKLTLLQDDRVHYNGQPVAVVVAETLEQAQHAADLVTIDYDSDSPTLDFDHAKAHAYAADEEEDYERGDPDAALAHASVRVSATYTTPLEYHNPMEPHVTTAVWEGERLTLCDSTQFISGVRKVVAKTLALKEEDVRVIAHHVGGGFGGKGSVWSHVVLAAMAAKKTRRAVRLALGRPQLFGPVGGRPRTEQKLKLASSEDGRLTAITHDYLSDTSEIEDWAESCGSSSRMLYLCENVRTTGRLVKLNVGTPTFQRAPGHAPGSFALESSLDELACRLAMDPVELRLRNDAERDPKEEKPWSSKSLRECFAAAGARFGWSRRTPQPRSMREGDTLIGYGMASATYPMHRMRASASVELGGDGTAIVRCGTQEIGTGTYAVMTQIAAETLGFAPESVRFELGDTDFPRAPITAGSMSVASVGPAVQAACAMVREKVIATAIADPDSPLHGLRAEDVAIEHGRLVSSADALRRESVAYLRSRHPAEHFKADSDVKPGKEAKDYSMHAFGAVFAEVHVDAELGEVRVERVVGAYGCGRVINVQTARNQIIGGITWGIGMALHEHGIVDARNGRIVNANLSAYHVPVNADVPQIEVIFVDEHDPHVNPLGAKGIGEIGITGVAAAIANAVYHATGRRIRDLPITVEKLL